TIALILAPSASISGGSGGRRFSYAFSVSFWSRLGIPGAAGAEAYEIVPNPIWRWRPSDGSSGNRGSPPGAVGPDVTTGGDPQNGLARSRRCSGQLTRATSVKTTDACTANRARLMVSILIGGTETDN